MAVAHDKDPVTDTDQLRHFGRDHHDSLALLGKLQDQLIDLVLGADVDAAGRLVEEQDLRLRQQPAAKNDLLLVAAGEVLDERLLRRRLDVHGGNGPVRIGGHFFIGKQRALFIGTEV